MAALFSLEYHLPLSDECKDLSSGIIYDDYIHDHDGDTEEEATPGSGLEPTPIDPSRIVTVEQVPFDGSSLWKRLDKGILAALCNQHSSAKF